MSPASARESSSINCCACKPDRPSLSSIFLLDRGEIIAVAKTEELHTGSTLGDLTMEPDRFPDADGRPGRDAEEPQRRQNQLLPAALHKLAEEEPTLPDAIRKRTNS